MQKAFLGRHFQRGLPEHPRCAATPVGYPCLIHQFTEEILAHQSISGYLLSIEIGRYKKAVTTVGGGTIAATEMFCRRHTIIDTLVINRYEAHHRDYILHGEK